MKKVLFTAIATVAMIAMVACNCKKGEEPVATDTTACEAVEACEHHCAMDSTCTHECMCGDECKAANCENCPNHGTENCCKAKAAAEGQACEKACDHKCDKAEGKDCCKKAEGKECCKKAEGKECCKKAEGKECEHKCQKAQ